MTVIAGYVDREAGCVHMAADSITIDGVQTMTIRKLVVRTDHGAPVIFGVAGRASIVGLVRHDLELPPLPDGDEEADRWAHGLAGQIAGLVDERRITVDEDRWEWYVMLACGPRLWELTRHLAIPVAEYHAIGSGAETAMGAMWTLAGGEAADVASSAVAAAISHVAGVGGSIQSAST